MARKTYTIDGLAQTHGANWHQVYHAIRRLRIQPVEGVGKTKVYGVEARDAIGKWLKSNARRKLSGAAASNAATG